MKIIICLLVLIAGAFWFFHGRVQRVPSASTLRDASADATAQAATAIAEVRAAAADVVRGQPPNSESSIHGRILAGEKVPERPNSVHLPAKKPRDSAAHDKLLRGERITENKRTQAP